MEDPNYTADILDSVAVYVGVKKRTTLGYGGIEEAHWEKVTRDSEHLFEFIRSLRAPR